MAQGLYDNGYLVHYEEGDRALFRDFLFFRGSVTDRYHTIVEGETLYSIARTYYSDSYQWYIIADANDSIEDIFDLTVGDIILIPGIILI